MDDSLDDGTFGLISSDYLIESKPKEKSIAASLAKYPNIPADIIAKADELYKKDDVKICRQRKRIHLLFYYTLEAYRELFGDVDPNKIGKIFDLKQGDTMTAVSTFNKKKKCTKIKFTSPISLIQTYCYELNIKDDEIVEEICQLCKDTLAKDPILMNSYPQTVASGILWYYFQTTNYEPDRQKFEKIVGRSTATIKKIAKQISIIDNE